MEKKLLILWMTAMESYKRQYHLFGSDALSEFREFGVFDMITENRVQMENLSYDRLAQRVNDFISKKKEEKELLASKPKRKSYSRKKVDKKKE
ncbi:MAG: hypothetical protein WCU80_08800 [Paludibacteraceae bacterium]|nr:hypothetical protein [Prevotellaceae bacterium]